MFRSIPRPQDLHNDLSSPSMTREELLEYRKNAIRYGIVKANILFYKNMSTEKLQKVADKKTTLQDLKETIQSRGGKVTVNYGQEIQDDHVTFEPLPEPVKIEEPKAEVKPVEFSLEPALDLLKSSLTD